MLEAIHEAAAPLGAFAGSSLTDGLRVIRTFERVNRRPFNPLDDYHRSLIAGMGAVEAMFRKFGKYTLAHPSNREGD
jgi:hypothetical protein